jgi:hypothetical protein
MKLQILEDLWKKFSGDSEEWLKTYPKFLGFQSKEEFSAKTPSRISDPKTIEELFLGGYKVRFKKGVKKITIFRFLLAKLLYEEEDGIHLDEFIVLLELYYSLLENKDPSFVNKYGLWLNHISKFIKDISRCQNFPARIKKERFTIELYQEFLDPYLPSQEAYFGLKGNRELRNSWVLTFSSQLLPQRLTSKRVIGVGYRDKGYRKSPEDGRPDWREVSSHFSEIFRRISNGEIPKDEVPPWLLQEYEDESWE